MPPPIPQRDERIETRPIPRRPPIGAVATAMVSGQGTLPFGDQVRQEEEEDSSSRPNNPYDLTVMAGSTVTASYPFHGDEDQQQLSFAVGDLIKVKQKEEMWSWGVLERSGKEGWFPHNYVGTTFKPLPGIHEMAAKIRKRRELQDAHDQQEAATSNQDSSSDLKSIPDVPLALVENSPSEMVNVVSGATMPEPNRSTESPTAHLSTESPAAHLSTKSPTGTGTGTEGVANSQEAVAGGAADDNGVKTVDVAASIRTNVATQNANSGGLVVATPSLPPFFKDTTSANAGKTVLLTKAVGETNAAEVVDETQIQGVGFAGKPVAINTGCACIIM